MRRRNFLTGALAAAAVPNFARAKVRVEQKDSQFKEAASVDICVLGGSCTGVFAAVRAARLGARVAIVEQANGFGGVAVNGLVNVWHSFMDTEFKRRIIAGMSQETVERLKKRGAVRTIEKSETTAFLLNPFELKTELDELILEAKVIPFLHSLFSEPYIKDGEIAGAIIDGKSGRRIIRAKYFIDATGDADFCLRSGFKVYTADSIQPATMCALVKNFDSKLIIKHSKEFNIPPTYVWGVPLPGGDLRLMAGTRISGHFMADSEDLTFAEIEGRRQIRAIMDIMHKYGKDTKLQLLGLPSYIGVRETRHIAALHKITEDEALNGIHYPDAIANGSYRFDVHHQDKPGVTFHYLNGTAKYVSGSAPIKEFTWRKEALPENPTFYQMPLRSLIPQNSRNVIAAGRMIDADELAFSGIRVMVNMNQLGEAAGVATYLALKSGKNIGDVPAEEVRKTLASGGSIII